MSNVNELLGRTLTKIENSPYEIVFTTSAGEIYKMNHLQNCCEDVYVESIVGDLDDLIGEPILLAEEVISEDVNPEEVTAPEYQDSFTWTFYKFATRKGYVDIRWYGQSNGYYSERVSFEEMSYQPKWEVRDRYNDTVKSPGVVLPDGHWWCIWDLPHKEFTPAVEQALKAAFELGYRAHFMQTHDLMPVRFFNG